MLADKPTLRFEPRRALGHTGFIATLLGIGDVADRFVPAEECVATLHRAMDHGLNVIDTAPGYEDGYSEQVVGAALKGRRDGMFVIDKIDFHDQPVAPQVNGSLTRLGLDHVDLFVLHGLSSVEGWDRAVENGGAMDQLAECIRAGKARFRGISSHDPDTLCAALNSGLCVDPRYIEQVLPLARRQGVGTVCFKTFGAGKLLGDTLGYNQPLVERPRGKLSSGGYEPLGRPTLPHLSVPECVHYTLSCDPDVALLGMSFPNEQDAAFQAAPEFKHLPPEAMARTRVLAARAVEGKGVCHWNPQ